MKKILAIFLALVMCCAFIACGREENMDGTLDANAGKDTETDPVEEYWLCGTGIPDGPDYTGGICKVYFKQTTVVLEGNLLKSMSREDYGNQIGAVETYDGEEIEVSADCVIIQDEGNEEKTYAYGEYREIMEISETDNAAGIFIAITVKNGKVTEIYYSA